MTTDEERIESLCAQLKAESMQVSDLSKRLIHRDNVIKQQDEQIAKLKKLIFDFSSDVATAARAARAESKKIKL